MDQLPAPIIPQVQITIDGGIKNKHVRQQRPAETHADPCSANERCHGSDNVTGWAKSLVNPPLWPSGVSESPQPCRRLTDPQEIAVEGNNRGLLHTVVVP